MTTSLMALAAVGEANHDGITVKDRLATTVTSSATDSANSNNTQQ
jgi:hypothetical protein